MAARRLVIVMIVLLAISTAVAVIAPQPAERLREEPTESTVAEPVEDPGWADPQHSDHLHSVVNTDKDEIPKRVLALVGDRLRLDVRGGPGRTVAIPDLGLVQTQARSAPATFELYFDEVGGYEVIEVESGDRLALIVIEVGDRKSAASAAPGAEASPQPEQPGASPQVGRA